MGAMASQITSLTIVYWNVYSGADQRKHQSSAPLAFVRGNSPMTGHFPAQMASSAENVSIWWRHHIMIMCHYNMRSRKADTALLSQGAFTENIRELSKITLHSYKIFSVFTGRKENIIETEWQNIITISFAISQIPSLITYCAWYCTSAVQPKDYTPSLHFYAREYLAIILWYMFTYICTHISYNMVWDNNLNIIWNGCWDIYDGIYMTWHMLSYAMLCYVICYICTAYGVWSIHT